MNHNEMTLRDLIVIVKDKLVVIIIIALICSTLVGVYKKLNTEDYYQASSMMFIQTQVIDGDLPGEASTIPQDYVGLIKNNKILEIVRTNLELDISNEDLSSKVTVSNAANTYLINVSVQDSNAETSTLICNEITKVAQEELDSISEIYKLIIVSYATTPLQPIKDNALDEMLIAFLFVLLLGAMVVILISYVKAPINTVEDIELELSEKYIGTIPKHKKDPEKNIRELNSIDAKILLENDINTILFADCSPRKKRSGAIIDVIVSMAQSGKKCIFIDSDLNDIEELDCIGSILDQSGESKINSLDSNEENIVYTVYKTLIPNLDVATTQTAKGNSGYIFERKNYIRLIDTLEKTYDLVLFTISVNDEIINTAVISNVCKKTILVIKKGAESKRRMLYIIKQLKALMGKTDGVLFK